MFGSLEINSYLCATKQQNVMSMDAELKKKLAHLEQVADGINDLRKDMIEAIDAVDPNRFEYEYISDLDSISTDELFDICQEYL